MLVTKRSRVRKREAACPTLFSCFSLAPPSRIRAKGIIKIHLNNFPGTSNKDYTRSSIDHLDSPYKQTAYTFSSRPPRIPFIHLSHRIPDQQKHSRFLPSLDDTLTTYTKPTTSIGESGIRILRSCNRSCDYSTTLEDPLNFLIR